MKNGKISESILKRSVLGQIKTHRDEVIKGAGIGEDCAFFAYKAKINDTMNADLLGVSTQTISLPVKKAGYLAVMAACNNLAASGVEPVSASASITMPQKTDEAVLRDIMKQMEKGCSQWNMELCGGHTEVSAAVNCPIITVTAMGKICEEIDARNYQFQSTAKFAAQRTELDIVVSKWIGIEGTAIVAFEKESELASRYPKGMIFTAQGFEQYLSVAPEAALAQKFGVCSMHDMRNGGVFGAAWEISRLLGVGLTIDLKKIPIKQETIEICEFYDLNPYVFLSGGSLLMVTKNGEDLVRQLETAGICATVIGQTNGGNDKIITNRDEVRYLEPTMPDEIWKVFFN